MRILRDSTTNVTSDVFKVNPKSNRSPIAQVIITGTGTDAPTVYFQGRLSDMPWLQIAFRTTNGIEQLPMVDEIRVVVTGQSTSPKTINVEIEQ